MISIFARSDRLTVFDAQLKITSNKTITRSQVSTIPHLSVIIPTLNEANTLPCLLQQLDDQEDINLEIIVADGGSCDNTTSIAQRFQNIVFSSERGRAKQLNAGAYKASYNHLLFLHADSSIEDPKFLSNAFRYFQEQQNLEHQSPNLDKKPRTPLAGHFPLKFSRSHNNNAKAFRFIEEKTLCNRPQTINGDQGLLISKEYFYALGEYDESMPILEDQRIAKKIFETGKWVVLPGTLTTSGRRFENEGFHRRYILMSLMMGLYWTNTHEFFIRAREVYPEQSETKKLKLTPFFKAIWLMLAKDLGLRRSIIQWYKVGKYVRENSWQMFFYVDVSRRNSLGPMRYPATEFHDRFIKPLICNVIFNSMTTVFVFCWYMLILGPVFFILDLFIKDD
ncbi:TIGR04283 family arsenosugar biosynthesis glycosyltransferase [Aurantivibrio infirmus]